MNVWQVSGGPRSRSYADVFLRHGVALIGPGDAGRWSPARPDTEFDGGFVRRFATEVQEGDALLLRTGRASIRAVGLVVGDYFHSEVFDDVNGWDLQHGRRARWFELPVEHEFDSPVFGGTPPRFSGVNEETVIKYAHRFLGSSPSGWQEASLPPLPEEDPPLTDLPAALRGIVAEAQDLQPLLWDRSRMGGRPSEGELVAHLIVPLLRVLGWPPERIAVGWRWIDVAVFTALPRTAENCRLVIEAKRVGDGVKGALEQAKGYLKVLGMERDVVLTDGVRYRLYGSKGGFAPLAYANLIRLKRNALRLF